MRAILPIVAMLGLSGCASDELRFSEQTVSIAPISAAVADFDRDGVPDLVVATLEGGPYISRGCGDGTFEDPAPIAPGKCVFFRVAAGDFDGDGWIDVAAAPGCAGGVVVFRNLGNGSFAPSKPLVVVDGTPVQAGDFDGDHRDEVVIVAGNGDAAMIRSFGDGAPGLAVDLPTYGALTAATADFDQDGLLDLVVSSGSSCNVTYAPADPKRTTTRGFASVPEAQSIAAGDFNRDGLPDLAAISYFEGYPLSVYLNDGRGSFASSGRYPTAEEQAPRANGDPLYRPASVATGDIDGDGILDLAVVDGYYANGYRYRLRVFTGTDDGSFTLNRTIAIGNSLFVLVADLDADGKADIVVSGERPGALTVLLSR
jgi:hypothetical protein